MRHAIAEAGCSAADIGYVNAHGTGTPLNDASEGAAFATVFGDGSAIPPRLRISSTKAAIGHTLGAAGSIEALFAIAALQSGQLPPNLNLRQPEPMAAANLVAVGEQANQMQATLSVNLGFGGSNAALLFKRYEQQAPVTGPTSLGGPFGPTQGRHGPPLQQLAICGMGAVLPSEISQCMKGLNGASGERIVRCVDKTSERLATLQNEPRVRRASPLTLFMLAAAQEALAAESALRRDRLGIVASFNTGAIVATRRFFEGVIKSGQRFASPNLFPETVFNSSTSHVAAVLGAAGPCYSVVGDEAAWVNAIRVAGSWLTNGLVDRVLVIGAVELDQILIDAFERAGWLQPHGRTGYVPSEGAGALLLRRAEPGDDLRIVQLADGFTYRKRSEAVRSARECLGHFPADVIRCRTAQHNWFGSIEEQLPCAKSLTLPYHGDAFVASAAWHTIAAAQLAQRERRAVLLPVWGVTGECSALLLGAGWPK
jgi:3-oxoacyl-(acyl-carrier-protein) synthase